MLQQILIQFEWITKGFNQVHCNFCARMNFLLHLFLYLFFSTDFNECHWHRRWYAPIAFIEPLSSLCLYACNRWIEYNWKRYASVFLIIFYWWCVAIDAISILMLVWYDFCVMRITILQCLYLIASENVFAMPEHTQCLIVLKWLHTIKLILSIKAHIENCGGKKNVR